MIGSIDEVKNCDWRVGTDGANSFIRRALGAELESTVELLTNRFAYWYGTR
jgi:2-polyprenyl-6-methoxyphenol hydroxylase-like FAD-dependent oxidoreductase